MADDIVTRLRDEIDSLKVDVQVLRDAADEIERLRSVGDALVASIRNHDLSESHVKAWQEARRG